MNNKFENDLNIVLIMIYFVVLMLFFISCKAEFEIDSDNDGLSDKQEKIFGLDPFDSDSDGDGIIDSKDLDPIPKPFTIKSELSDLIMGSEDSRAIIRTILIKGKDTPVENAKLHLDTDLGVFSSIKYKDSGEYIVELESSNRGLANIIIKYTDSENSLLTVKSNLSVYFILEDDLPQPGNNTAAFSENKSLDKNLKVFAVYGYSTGYQSHAPIPFKNAFIQIEKNSQLFPLAYTNSAGFVEIEDENLKGPVNITVGYLGFRTVSIFNVNSYIVTVPLFEIDKLNNQNEETGAITGKVIGWRGNEHIPPFPEGSSIFGQFNAAIVQLAAKNVPLVSMSMSNMLEYNSSGDNLSLESVIPKNFVIADLENPENNIYRLENIRPGEYLIYSLAGITQDILKWLQDPYYLNFDTKALGIEKVVVEAGQTLEKDIELNINLNKGAPFTEQIEVFIGNSPKDIRSCGPDFNEVNYLEYNCKTMSNIMLLPALFTEDQWVISSDIEAGYNLERFSNPLITVFPTNDHFRMIELGLKFTPLIVAVAGRDAYNGAILPGLSAAVSKGFSTPVNFNIPESWAHLPITKFPKAPLIDKRPDEWLDSVSFPSVISWRKPLGMNDPELYTIRINYMTSPPYNPFTGGTIGGPESHFLWEIYIPGYITEIIMPKLPEFATLISNPVPTDISNSVYHYNESNLEFEITAYYLEYDTNQFDFNNNFFFYEVNYYTKKASQDSFIFSVSD